MQTPEKAMDSPAYWRHEIRAGRWRRPTAGLAAGYAQANLVVVPRDHAQDFQLFCHLNPKPCPLLDVTRPGDPIPRTAAPEADLRTDLPGYRVYIDGEMVAEQTNLMEVWQPDFIGFLLGCSFTFEAALLQAGIPVRHIECDRNVPMFVTTQMCQPAGVFVGPLVVSMRPIPEALVPRAAQICARYPLAHGGPVHIGDPGALGIHDLNRPDFGNAVPIEPGEVPVFWACGVTPQAVAQRARLPLVITHAPGHMFLTDLRDEDMNPR